MSKVFGNLFKPIGPQTASSRPPQDPSNRSSTFPVNSFLTALAVAVVGGLLIGGAGFGFSGPENELMGADLGGALVTGVAASLGSFVGGLLAGALSKELIGPFSAVPIASLVLMASWIAAGVTDSLVLLLGATVVPMGAGVAIGFVIGTGIRNLTEKAKENLS